LFDIAQADNRSALRHEVVDIHHDVLDPPSGLGGNGTLVDRFDYTVENLLARHRLHRRFGNRKREFGGDNWPRRGGQQNPKQ